MTHSMQMLFERKNVLLSSFCVAHHILIMTRNFDVFVSLQQEKEEMKNIVSDNPQLKQRNAKIKLFRINDWFFPHLGYLLP